MLKKVHIQNFKSLKHVTLELGRNSILVGPNMSGKSNFLDFFKFVQDLIFPTMGMTSGLQSALNLRNGFGRVAWGGVSENSIIRLGLEGEHFANQGSLEWRYWLELLGNQWGGGQVLSESLELKKNGDWRSLIETQGQNRGILGPNGQTMVQLSDTSKLALEYELPNWEGNFLRRSIFSWRFYNLLPPLMRKPNPTTAVDSLSVHGENLSAWLMSLQTKNSDCFERIRAAAKDVFPGLENLFTSPTAQTTVYLASKEKFLSDPVTVAEMSDGELTFLALLSLLFAPPRPQVDLYFIEEPENHLHPRLMTVLVDLLRQIQAEVPPESHPQFMITTHSPYLVDKFSIEELIVLSRREGESIFSRPGDKKQLRELVNNEEIGLGDLYYSGALSLA
jgi:predicted ATPase